MTPDPPGPRRRPAVRAVPDAWWAVRRSRHRHRLHPDRRRVPRPRRAERLRPPPCPACSRATPRPPDRPGSPTSGPSHLPGWGAARRRWSARRRAAAGPHRSGPWRWRPVGPVRRRVRVGAGRGAGRGRQPRRLRAPPGNGPTQGSGRGGRRVGRACRPRSGSAHPAPHEDGDGQPQRACPARALALRTRWLVRDEMTVMLDASTTAALVGVVDEHRAETAAGLLAVGHDPVLLDRRCDRVRDRDEIVKHRAPVTDGQHPYGGHGFRPKAPLPAPRWRRLRRYRW